MKAGLLLLVLAIASFVASSQAQSAARTADLLNNCRTIDRGKRAPGHRIKIPRTKEALLCWGYMQAMQDLSVWVDENGQRIMGACPTERTTLLAMIHSFVRYAGSHRRQVQGNAAVAVMRALQDAFPCKETTALRGGAVLAR